VAPSDPRRGHLDFKEFNAGIGRGGVELAFDPTPEAPHRKFGIPVIGREPSCLMTSDSKKMEGFRTIVLRARWAGHVFGAHHTPARQAPVGSVSTIGVFPTNT